VDFLEVQAAVDVIWDHPFSPSGYDTAAAVRDQRHGFFTETLVHLKRQYSKEAAQPSIQAADCQRRRSNCGICHGGRA
jgi:hypothetical protein